MPRFEARGGGIQIPGLYRALLEKERQRCAEPDPRRIWSGDPGEPAAVFHRSRRLLDALEAGKPVVMVRWMVGSHVSVPPVVLPWDRSVKSVLVSPDDVVSPAEGDGSWPGGAAEDDDHT